MKLSEEQVKYLLQRADMFASANELYTIQQQPLTMMPFVYGKEIENYVQWMYNHNLVMSDYGTIEKEYKDNYNNEVWYETISEENIIQCLALAIRKDRLIDGFLLKTIQDHSFLQLMNRLKQLHNSK